RPRTGAETSDRPLWRSTRARPGEIRPSHAGLSERDRHARATREGPHVNVVDSSAWLEYFADGPNAKAFALAIEKTAELLVPSLVLFEVFKRVLLQRNESAALEAVAIMQQAHVIDLDG